MKELDWQVAVRVIGLTFCSCSHWAPEATWDGYIKCDLCKDTAPYPAPYSTDLNRAYDLIKLLQKNHIMVSIDINVGGPVDINLLRVTPEGDCWQTYLWVQGDTLPKAICEAALKAFL